MKIAHQNAAFHPITITLETEEEAAVLAAMLGEHSPLTRASLAKQRYMLDTDVGSLAEGAGMAFTGRFGRLSGILDRKYRGRPR